MVLRTSSRIACSTGGSSQQGGAAEGERTEADHLNSTNRLLGYTSKTSTFLLQSFLNQTTNLASVNMQVGFQRFLNLGNPWKPPKTRELGNLDTHVPFPGNLTNIYAVGTVETYRNLRNLLKKNVTKKF